MIRYRLGAFALCSVILAFAIPARAAESGACRVISRGTDPVALRALFATHGRTLVLTADTVLLCDCADPRRLGMDDESRRGAVDDDARRIGADSESRRGGEDDEGRRLGGDTEARRGGEDAENRRLGGDTEARRGGEDAEDRRLGADDERRRDGADAETRRIGGDHEGRRLGSDTEARRGGADNDQRLLAGDAEGRRLGGDDGVFTCRKEPTCGGFLVGGVVPLRLFDGAAVREASNRCIQ